MAYKLKPNQPDFEVVDGPFEGRKFKGGEIYEDVPVNELHRFREIKEDKPEAGKVKNTEGKKKDPASDSRTGGEK